MKLDIFDMAVDLLWKYFEKVKFLQYARTKFAQNRLELDLHSERAFKYHTGLWTLGADIPFEEMQISFDI